MKRKTRRSSSKTARSAPIELNVDGREMTESVPVRTDSPLHVVVTLRAATVVPCPAVDVAVYRNDGVKLFGVTSDRTGERDRRELNNEWRLDFTMDLSPLMHQAVYIDIGVRERLCNQYYLTWYRASTLELHGDVRGSTFSPDSILKPDIGVTATGQCARDASDCRRGTQSA